jgi:hypothetical protein
MLEAAREGVEPIREFDVFRDPGYTARADSKLGPDETKVVHKHTHTYSTHTYIHSHIVTNTCSADICTSTIMHVERHADGTNLFENTNITITT